MDSPSSGGTAREPALSLSPTSFDTGLSLVLPWKTGRKSLLNSKLSDFTSAEGKIDRTVYFLNLPPEQRL